MTGLQEAYAAPQSDDDATELEEPEADARPGEWYAIPLWRLFLFSLLGGSVYQLHYMYRSWKAHRRSFGYSAQAVWQARYEATGFRVSPFWRAALVLHSYSWLVVVSREARAARVPFLGSPGLWFILQWAALVLLPEWWNVVALSIVFLPAQLTVNRLHDRHQPRGTRAVVTAEELCWLALGLFASYTALSRLWAW